jgi:hypothetical protein
MPAGERTMTRLLAAAMLLAAAAPAFACDYNKTVSTDKKPSTVASQQTNDRATPPASTRTPAEHTRS